MTGPGIFVINLQLTINDYNCVKAGLEVKFNLWSKGGNEYFSLSKKTWTPVAVPVPEEKNEEKNSRNPRDLVITQFVRASYFYKTAT